jgi:electron transfer flavoprotein beta subunit
VKTEEGSVDVDIIVLIKQVPATESLIEIAGDGVSIKTDAVKWVMNPYDEFAVEEALRIREKQGGSVTLISAGSAAGPKAQETLRVGLAMGADKAIFINDPAVAGCDGLGIARLLTAVIKDTPYDLIIAGQRAVDDDAYLAGQAVAENLKIPAVNLVVKEEIADGKIQCHRTVEGGTVVLEAPLPALITTQRGLNEPRYTSLPGIMKAKKKPIDVKTIADLGIDPADLAPKAKILALKKPPERGGGRIIEGETPAEKAQALVTALKEEAKVI